MPEPIGLTVERRSRDRSATTIVCLQAVVGQREWVALPDFGIGCVQAWLDPLDEVSVLQASDITALEIDGERWARLSIRPIPDDERTVVEAEAPLASPTAGEPVIRTLVTLGSETWPVDLRLVSHRLARAPLHLGRDALGERVAVERGKVFLAGPPQR